jgi:hypothetical protein
MDHRLFLAFAILLDALLCLIFGGRDRLREFGSDPVHWYWLVFAGCGTRDVFA